jgi:GWxTD domain-containing protein
MTALQEFVRSALARAIGWAILHSLWQGAVLALVLGVLLLVTRSPRVRYAAGCVALAMACGAFAFTLARLLPASSAGSSPVKPVISMSQAASSDGGAAPWYANLSAIVPWMAPLWFSGVLLVYVRALGGCVSMQRLRRRGVCSPAPSWQAELTRLAGLLRLSRPVQLLESSLAEVPMAIGHLKPLVLVPAGLFAGLAPSQVELILLHELAHIRRHDYLVNVMQRLVEGALFYHPAVWWISGVIRGEREKCCDDVVVAVTANPQEYARTLAALEQQRFSGRQLAVAARGGHLMKRIHRLLYPSTQSTAWGPVLAAGVLLGVATISLAAWPSRSGAANLTAGAGTQDPGEAARLEKQARESEAATLERYAKWLNQDVVYIIDDAERAAFEKLTSNEDREKFIEQFWERRNPNPGSSANAFKEEHCRRIAYANKHFGTASGTAGWQTDRGHIYILYGAPDEIDAHSKTEQKPAKEYWMYRHVEGVGDNGTVTFVDKSGRGDYHLAPGGADPRAELPRIDTNHPLPKQASKS